MKTCGLLRQNRSKHYNKKSKSSVEIPWACSPIKYRSCGVKRWKIILSEHTSYTVSVYTNTVCKATSVQLANKANVSSKIVQPQFWIQNFGHIRIKLCFRTFKKHTKLSVCQQTSCQTKLRPYLLCWSNVHNFSRTCCGWTHTAWNVVKKTHPWTDNSLESESCEVSTNIDELCHRDMMPWTGSEVRQWLTNFGYHHLLLFGALKAFRNWTTQNQMEWKPRSMISTSIKATKGKRFFSRPTHVATGE